MLENVSTEIIRELKQKSRTFRAKIYKKSTGELLTDSVRALTCTGASSDGSDITVGQAFPRSLTFSCADIGLKEGDEINVVIALKVRSNFVGGDMPFGEFTITNAVKGLDGIDYTTYDKLYINSTKDVTSLSTSFDSACTAIGNLIGAPFSKSDSDVFPYGSTSQSHLSAIKELDENAGYKALEMAGFLAGLVGCNAFINRNGNLVFKAQQDVNIGYALDDRIEDKTLEFQVTIGSIEVRGARGAEDVYTLNRSNSKGAKLYVENPLAMSAQDVAWRIDNRMTHGADIVNKGALVMKLGDPRIDPWDIIDNYACSALTMEFDGGISTNIESIVKTDQERSIEEKDRIKQVKAELEAMQSAVDDVASGFEDLESDFGDLSGSVEDLETEVGEIGGGLDELGGTVDDLSGEVDLMGDSIEDLEDEVETIQTNYETFLADYQAFKKMAEAGLGSTTGYYKTEQKVNGATITYMHDQPQLSNSTYIWKFTIDSIACSIDGGQTYPFGMTVDGQLVQQYITADIINGLQINAGAIKTGTLSVDRIDFSQVEGFVRENLLPETDLTNWNKQNTSVKCEYKEGYYEVSYASTITSRYGVYYDLEVEPSTTYTLSFDVYNSFVGLYTVTGASASTAFNAGTSYEEDGRQSKTFTTGSNHKYLRIYFYRTGSTNCCVGNVKLEVGSEDTGFVVDTEKRVTEISQHEISVAELNADNIKSGTIEGVKINSLTTESSPTKFQISDGALSDMGATRSFNSITYYNGLFERKGVLHCYFDRTNGTVQGYDGNLPSAGGQLHLAGTLLYMDGYDYHEKSNSYTGTRLVEFDPIKWTITFNGKIGGAGMSEYAKSSDIPNISPTTYTPSVSSPFSALSGSIKKYTGLGFVVVTIRLSVSSEMTAGTTYTAFTNANLSPASIPASLSCVWYGTASRLKKVVQAYVNSSGAFIISPTEDIAGEGYLAVTGTYLI